VSGRKIHKLGVQQWARTLKVIKLAHARYNTLNTPWKAWSTTTLWDSQPQPSTTNLWKGKIFYANEEWQLQWNYPHVSQDQWCWAKFVHFGSESLIISTAIGQHKGRRDPAGA